MRGVVLAYAVAIRLLEFELKGLLMMNEKPRTQFYDEAYNNMPKVVPLASVNDFSLLQLHIMQRLTLIKLTSLTAKDVADLLDKQNYAVKFIC